MARVSNVFTIKSPSWLPGMLADQLLKSGKLEYFGKFTPAEKKVLRRRKQIPVSRWCEKHRVVTTGGLPGRWKNRVTPYIAGVMDASFFSSVREITVCAAPQVAKSEAVNNCIGYAVDRAPGPVLYVYPDEQTARDNSRDRIRPMIETSARLRSYLTGMDDDVSSMRINLQHMPIYMAWARSAARLANKPIRYLVFDETDKYPETSGKKETDPISLGKKRTRTYRWNYKIWKISSPTTEDGFIWVALTKESQAVFDYYVRCPFCDHHHLMTFEDIKFPEDERDPERVEGENLAWYQCPNCGETWDDDLRNRAVNNGDWIERESGLTLMAHLKKHRPQKIGFHIPSWLSIFVGLSEVAAAFLRGLKDKTKLKDFQNGHKAVPWIDYVVERDEDHILALRDERPAGLVPSGNVVAALTGAIDTQDNGFFYEIRAWGYGLTQESWQIRNGFAANFAQLEKILFDDAYLDAEGKKYLVRLSVIDSGGHRTSEVYDWCRVNRGRVFAVKGVQTMNQPVSWSKIDVYPGTNKPIVGGIRLARVNTTYFKNKLANMLEIAPADPGAWHMHSELSIDWARQMTSEYVDEKGIWQVRQSMANHGWDVSGYGLAAAEILGVRFWQKKQQEKKEEKPVIPAQNGNWVRGNKQNGSWIKNK